MVLPDAQISVTVRSSTGDDGPITVHDGLRQVLDFFDLLTLAQAAEGQDVAAWHLVSISKASPLTAVAKPYIAIPGFVADQLVRRAKERVFAGLTAITSGSAVPDWVDNEALDRTRAILTRNLDTIGRTDVRFGDGLPATIIVQQNARVGLLALDRAVLDRKARVPDLSRNELGSIEGIVTDATTFRGKPAIRVNETLTGAEVVCIMSPAISEKIGHQHDWQEVWTGARVLAVGELVYRKDGQIIQVFANDVQIIKAQPLRYQDIADPDATGGLSPSEHIAKFWVDVDG